MDERSADSETTTVSLRVASYLRRTSGALWHRCTTRRAAAAGRRKQDGIFPEAALTAPNADGIGIACDTTPHVIAIDLQNNNLTGELPDLSAFSGLLTFGAVANHLTGGLPASIQNLPSMTQIALSNNQLSGNLDVLNGLPNLQYFGGDGNVFTGVVPQLNSMPNLMGFSVDANQLTGSMPSLAQSSKLVYLSVSANYLDGTFPSLNALTKLRYLYISGNRFSGVMPNPPNPTQLGSGVVDLCPNFFAPMNNTQWNVFSRTNPWYRTAIPTRCSARFRRATVTAMTRRENISSRFGSDSAHSRAESQAPTDDAPRTTECSPLQAKVRNIGRIGSIARSSARRARNRNDRAKKPRHFRASHATAR